MSGPPGERIRRLVLMAGLAFCCLWIAASLTFPLGWDHGIFATAGDVILSGGMPYRDAWDIKGPLAHLWFALAQAIFGRGQMGIRVLDAAILIWAALVLWRATSRVHRPAVGVWSAIALVLCHGSLTFFYTAQPDAAASHAMVIGFAPLLAGVTNRRLVQAAACVGLATLVKPLYLAFLLVPLLAAWQSDGDQAGRGARRGAAILAAAMVPVVPVIVWFVMRGAMGDLIDVLFRYNAQDYSGAHQLAVRTRLMGYADYFWTGFRAPAVAFVALGAVFGWRSRAREARLVLLWFVLALALVGVQGKFYPYHWTIVFPPAILLVSRPLEALRAAGSPAPAFASIAAIAMIAPLTVQPGADVFNWARYEAGRDPAPRYFARFFLGPYNAGDAMEAANYIHERTRDGDRVAILGYESPILYLSGRANATRFSYALPLVSWRSSREVIQQYRREFLASIADRPPYIIIGMLLLDEGRSVEVFPELLAVLTNEYTADRTFGPVTLYRRNAGR